MDFVSLVNGIGDNARPLGAALLVFGAPALVLKSRVAKKIWSRLEETMFSNWQLALLGTTGVVLSLASGYTTWDEIGRAHV